LVWLSANFSELTASGCSRQVTGWDNPERRHSSLGMVSPAHFEQLDNNVMVAA
jgi:hypothetical protein